jgi:phosphoribosylglycinamide formyltransferase 1
MAKTRVAILISGRGSNMMSLIEAASAKDYPAEIALVVSNRPDAAGIARANAKGIKTLVIDHTQFGNRVAFEARLHQTLLDWNIELICNAGFMRMLTGGFVDRWRDKQLNIHPSLLPALPGLHTHQRAIDQGLMITGCTVHFVRLEMDSGPIVAQAAVPVMPDDTEETLGARVLEAELKVYPHALRLVASGVGKVVNDRFVVAPPAGRMPSLIWPPLA